MVRSELKRRLRAISQKGTTNVSEVRELLPAMLEFIGSPDPQLRDDLIYEHLSNWILDGNLIHQSTCKEILYTIMDEEHLFFGIGEKDTNSVFTRSFSVLQIPPLLISHQANPYLSVKDLQQVNFNLHCFIQLEADRRGYVQGKGWAHAVAHYADAVDSLVRCDFLKPAETFETIQALKNVILFDQLPYSYGEDERLAEPVHTMLLRDQLSHEQITEWVDEIGKDVLSEKSVPQKFIRRENSKGFLQALYFRLKWKKEFDDVLDQIDRVLHEINPFTNKGSR